MEIGEAKRAAKAQLDVDTFSTLVSSSGKILNSKEQHAWCNHMIS